MGFSNKFYLDNVEIDEPEGWDSFEISITRDKDLHGIGFEAGINSLRFYGKGMRYIDDVKDRLGLKSKIIFSVSQNCGGPEYEIIFSGKLNMGKYKKSCGLTCYVTIDIDSASCETTLSNRFEQDVDVDKTTSQNNLIALPAYPKLNFDIQLPARELDYLTEGYVIDAEPLFTIGPTVAGTQTWIARPDYGRVVASNFKQTELTGAELVGFLGSSIISPNLLWDERLGSFPNPISIHGRLKGNIDSAPLPLGASEGFLVVVRGEISPDDWAFGLPGGASISDRYEQIAVQTLWNFGETATNIDFDLSYVYDWFPNDGGTDGIYAFITVTGGVDYTYKIQWDKETFFKAQTTRVSPPTNTKAYMVHETLSRITESITDGCMRVKSSFYGRTDSEPFSFDQDGCGGLRLVTSGLKIRNAENPTFFESLKNLMQGLQNIDNVGMGIEPEGNKYLLRIEDLDFFYNEFEILQHLHIAEASFEMEEERDFSIIKFGYKKWETKSNFGLDEFNSEREYHLDIETLNNTVDIASNLVAAGAAIEVTREQTGVETNNADTTYDNETFIICLKRIAYNFYQVEQGNILNPQNIFSPLTAYNYRISPLRNLMRWYRSLITAYPNIKDSLNKLYFSSGTGNLQASGQLAEGYGYSSVFCKEEGVDIKENTDLFITMFNNIASYTPLWANETISYNYPMSVREYNLIKANRYGFISYQCGNGAIQKGWIKDIKYNPEQGMANVTLRQKWEEKILIEPKPPIEPPIEPPTGGAGLRLLFDDIINAPANNLLDWNTFFNTADHADTPFSSVIVLGNEVTLIGAANLEIKDNLFDNNIHLLSVIDIDSVIKVLASSFIDAINLSVVTLPILTSIGNFGFQGCDALTSIEFLSCTTLGQQAFAFCDNLGAVNLPAVSVIPPSCFVNCIGLADILSLQNVTEIQSNAFNGCSNMTPPTFNNLTDIGVGSFLGCSIMNSFSAPLLVNIGSEAFEDCIALTGLNIPACTNLGGSTGNNFVFLNIIGNTMTVTIPTATASDLDITDLQANNTVTLTLV